MNLTCLHTRCQGFDLPLSVHLPEIYSFSVLWVFSGHVKFLLLRWWLPSSTTMSRFSVQFQPLAPGVLFMLSPFSVSFLWFRLYSLCYYVTVVLMYTFFYITFFFRTKCMYFCISVNNCASFMTSSFLHKFL
jgi:hypothetical protein